MSDSMMIKEFLVGLGFKTDEAALKKFTNSIEGATKAVGNLVGAISFAALAVGGTVMAFAGNMEALYFASKRVGASANNLKAWEMAGRDAGATAEQMRGSIEGLASFVRNTPGADGFLKGLGVDLVDAQGKARDTVDVMADLSRSFQNMPVYMANQYAKILGIDERAMLAMRDPKFLDELKKHQAAIAGTDYDKIAKNAHDFDESMRKLEERLKSLGYTALDALQKKMGPALDKISAWWDKNGQAVTDRMGDILAILLNIVAQALPGFEKLLDVFVDLDKSTGGWSTKIVLFGLVFGGLATKVWAVVAALRAMSAASAAAAAAEAGAAAGGAGAGAAGAAAGGGLLAAAKGVFKFLAKGSALLYLATRSGDLNSGEDEELAKHRGTNTAESAFAKLISRGEGNYSSVNMGEKGVYRSGTKNLSSMTVAEVMAAQNKGEFNAAGRYQIIRTTLAQAVASMGLKGDEKFDKTTQDRIFEQYLIGQRRKEIGEYISGKSNDIKAAMKAASLEWASVTDPDTGKSHYAGIANNRASISESEMRNALENSRRAYQPMRPDLGIPNAESLASSGASGASISQNTTINVNGVSDPEAAARAVAREQDMVNIDLTRNIKGATS